MAKNDVQLVIRAKNAASKALDAVTGALKDLTAAQEKAAESAAEADGLLAQLGQEIQKLNRQAEGLAALGKLSKGLEQAADGVARLEAEIAETNKNISDLNARQKEAAATSQQLAKEVEAAARAYADQQTKTREAKQEQTRANRELRNAEKRYQALAERVKRAKKPSEDLRKELAAQGQQVAELRTKQQAANQAYADQAAALAVARTGLSDLSSRLRAAQASERELAAEATKAGRALETQTRQLQAARAGLDEMSARAREASKSLGVVGLDQRKIAEASRQTTVRIRELNASLREQQAAGAGTTARAANEVRRLGAAFRLTATSARRYAEALRSTEHPTRTALSLGQRLRGQLLSITAAYTGLFQIISQVSSVVNAFRALESVENRLGAVFQQNMPQVAAEVSWLRQEAIRLGMSFQVLGEEYSKFAVAANAANFRSEATRKIFTSVAEAARVNKLSLEQTSGVLLALQQMISKGRVQSEELRRQLGDRLPGAFNIMADAIGVTTAELDQMMAKGQLVANESTLLKFAEELDRRFGKQLPDSLRSLTAEIGRFQALFFDAQVQIAQAGFADSLRDVVKDLNAQFRSREGRAFFEDLGAALSKVMDLLRLLGRNLDSISAFLKAFLAIRVARTLVGWVTGLRQVSGEVVKAASAFAKSRSSLLGFLSALQMRETHLLARNLRYTQMQINGLTRSFSLARVQAALLGAGLTAVRGALVSLAAAARAAWAAIGGVAGIVLTGVTYLLGEALAKWMTSTDKLNTAMEQHANLMDRVQQHYNNVKDGAADWQEQIALLSRQEIILNTQKLEDQLRTIQKEFRLTRDDMHELVLSRPMPALVEAVRAFRAGQMSGSEFKKTLDDLRVAERGLGRELVQRLYDVANQALTVEDALKKNAALLRYHAGEATFADMALLGLNNTMKETAEVFDMGGFEEQLRNIKEMIPELANEMKKMEALEAIAKFERDAISAAKSLDELIEMLKLADQARTAVEEKFLPKESRDREAEERRRNQERLDARIESRSGELARENQFVRERIGLEGQALAAVERRQHVEREVARLQEEAERQGLQIDQQKLETLKQLLGEEFDLANAQRLRTEQQQQVEQEVNDLLEHRRLLMEQIQYYQEQGDSGMAQTLMDSLSGVNSQLEEAINNAIAFWEAMGGAAAERAILRLQNLQNSVKQTQDGVRITGREMEVMFARRAADALDSLAEKIAEGQNVVKAFGQAFLQMAADFLREIAKMIMQQMILNAISGMFGKGLSFTGVGAGVKHAGGLAGTGPTRRVSPLLFRNALRYHSGGIVGLKPGEVPAILKRNEEVLTEDDPRHVFNSGGKQAQDIKIINTIDPGEFVSKGLASALGEKTVLNFIKANSGAVRAALGVS